MPPPTEYFFIFYCVGGGGGGSDGGGGGGSGGGTNFWVALAVGLIFGLNFDFFQSCLEVVFKLFKHSFWS